MGLRDELLIKQMKIDQQVREIERLRGLLSPFAAVVEDRGYDGRDCRFLSVTGRAGNDAYRGAWLALNPQGKSK